MCGKCVRRVRRACVCGVCVWRHSERGARGVPELFVEGAVEAVVEKHQLRVGGRRWQVTNQNIARVGITIEHNINIYMYMLCRR